MAISNTQNKVGKVFIKPYDGGEWNELGMAEVNPVVIGVDLAAPDTKDFSVELTFKLTKRKIKKLRKLLRRR